MTQPTLIADMDTLLVLAGELTCFNVVAQLAVTIGGRERRM